MYIFHEGFDPADIEGTIIGEFTPAINMNRLTSFNGKLIITTEKVYLMPDYQGGTIDAIGAGFYEPRCFGLNEIAEYKKTGLAGFRITLKDGTVFNFSNVFGKMRKGIIAALEEGLSK